MTFRINSLGFSHGVMLNHNTYPFFEKVFIYMHILALMFVAFGIRHVGWSMYYRYLTWLFCFHEKLPYGGYH
jgi:hypothetical protein